MVAAPSVLRASARKTEGVLFHLSPDAFSTALGEAFEILEQRAHSAQPREKLSERAGAVGLMQAAARRVDERQAKDLAGALVNQEVDAVLGDSDVGFEAGAQVRRVAEASRQTGFSSQLMISER